MSLNIYTYFIIHIIYYIIYIFNYIFTFICVYVCVYIYMYVVLEWVHLLVCRIFLPHLHWVWTSHLDCRCPLNSLHYIWEWRMRITFPRILWLEVDSEKHIRLGECKSPSAGTAAARVCKSTGNSRGGVLLSAFLMRKGQENFFCKELSYKCFHLCRLCGLHFISYLLFKFPL